MSEGLIFNSNRKNTSERRYISCTELIVSLDHAYISIKVHDSKIQQVYTWSLVTLCPERDPNHRFFRECAEKASLNQGNNFSVADFEISSGQFSAARQFSTLFSLYNYLNKAGYAILITLYWARHYKNQREAERNPEICPKDVSVDYCRPADEYPAVPHPIWTTELNQKGYSDPLRAQFSTSARVTSRDVTPAGSCCRVP